MKTRLRAISTMLALGVAGALIMGCTPLYIAPAANAPLFAGTGEVHVSGQLGNSLEGQVAIAVANQVGVVGNISHASGEGSDLFGITRKRR